MKVAENKLRVVKEGERDSPSYIRIWDVPVRVFHWVLITCIAVAWFSAGTNSDLHESAGYVALGMILFRLWWGFAGTRYARFSNFYPTPGRLLHYLGSLKAGRSKRHLGHNPAGAAMIFALLGLIGIITSTGWMMLTRRYFGVEWVENVHTYATYTLLALIPLHVAGVLLASYLHKENLIWAMFTGSKRAEPGFVMHAGDTGYNDHLHDRIRSMEAFAVMTALILVATVTWNKMVPAKKTMATTPQTQTAVQDMPPAAPSAAQQLTAAQSPPEDLLVDLAAAFTHKATALAYKLGNKLDARQFALTACKAILLSKQRELGPVLKLLRFWNPQVIQELQRVLRKVGHYDGRIDGRLRLQTMAAITAFRKSAPRPDVCRSAGRE